VREGGREGEIERDTCKSAVCSRADASFCSRICPTRVPVKRRIISKVYHYVYLQIYMYI